jgi:23S rRNA pseudouridine955/2504/2580 synthase
MVVGRITRKATIKVPPSGAGALLLDYLAHRFTYQNRDEWRRCILEGQVLLDGKCPRTTAILNAGHTLTYLPPQLQEPAVDTRFRIVYEDEGMLVIEKPANLPSHPSGRYFQNTLLTLLRNRPGLQSATLVNRPVQEEHGL